MGTHETLCPGGARRDRTADLYTASVALSQLSYSPERDAHFTRAKLLSQERNLIFLIFFTTFSQLAFALHFCPGITQGNGTIKHRSAMGVIGIGAEVTLAFKLKYLARLGLSQRRLKHTPGQAAQ